MGKSLLAVLTALLAFTSAFEFTARASTPDRQIFIADGSRAPDVFVQTLFDDEAQAKLLTEVRKALKASTEFDPLSHRFPKPITIVAKLNTKMNGLVRDMVQKLVNMKFEDADIVISIEGLHYETPKATLRIGAVTANSNGIDLPVTIRLRETVVSAERILIRFRTNSKTRSFLDKFYVELKGTSLSSKSLDSLSLDLVVNARMGADGSTTLTLPTHSFSSFESMQPEQLQNELTLTPGTVTTPSMSINIGRTQLNENIEAFNMILETRKASLARMVFEPLVAEIRKIPETILKSKQSSIVLPPSIEFDVPCLGKTSLKLMQYGRIGANQLMMGIGVLHPEYKPGSPSGHQFTDAGDALHDKIGMHTVTAGIGIRDRFIAWGMEKALRGCLKDKLPPTLALGPAGVHARMGKDDGSDGVLALHAQSPLKGFIAKVILKDKTRRAGSFIEFPIKVAPKLEFRSGGAEPAKFQLDLSSADLSPETLKDGFDGIPSNIVGTRGLLRGTVLKKIQGQLSAGLGNAKVEVPMAFLQSSDMSYAEIQSDQAGHLDLLLSLDADVRPGAVGFWESMAPFLKRAFAPKESLQ